MILVAPAAAGDIVQPGKGRGRLAVAGAHFRNHAPGFYGLKKPLQIHVGAAQFAPAFGIGRGHGHLGLERTHPGLKRAVLGGSRCRGRTALLARVIPSAAASNHADHNDSCHNQEQAFSVHGVFSDTIGRYAITPDEEHRGQMRDDFA